MALFITCGKEWLNTIWAKEKISYLIKEANKKKIDYYFFFSLEELKMYEDKYQNEKSCIVIVANLEKVDEKIINEYKKSNMPIIISAHSIKTLTYGEYSFALDDMEQSMQKIFEIINKRNCKHPAVVGLISQGYQDSMKIDYYKKYNKAKKQLIFDTKTMKLFESVKKLFNSNEVVDAIICSNDFQAIRLMKIFDLIDPNWNDKLLLFSFGNTKLGSFSKPTITSGTFGFKEVSIKTIQVYEALIKDPSLLSMRVVVKANFYERESSNKNKPRGILFKPSIAPSDEKIKEIINEAKKAEKLEEILINLDDVDLSIIYGLMLGKKRKEISLSAHCSESTVKYRLKGYKNTLKCDTTKQLADILKEYISMEKLVEKVKN